MTYNKQMKEIVKCDMECMVMDFVERHFSEDWCIDCPAAENNVCPEDFYDDMCPMCGFMNHMQDVARDFANIIVEACNS